MAVSLSDRCKYIKIIFVSFWNLFYKVFPLQRGYDSSMEQPWIHVIQVYFVPKFSWKLPQISWEDENVKCLHSWLTSNR